MSRRWSKGKATEARFWRGYVAQRPDLEQRLDPDLPLQEYVSRWLDPSAESASILDVGAGPLTSLGRVWEGHRLEVTAVDVLGEAYAKILTERGIDPPVRTIQCATEELSARFPENRFDLVHAENAIDHHADVVEAITQMLYVVRPGGHIVMTHARNEAETRGYHGLHQWNLAIEGDDYLVWNKEVKTSIRQEFDDRAELVHLGEPGGGRELVVLKKRTQPEGRSSG